MSTKEDNNGSGGSGLSVKVETTQQRIINAIFTVFAKINLEASIPRFFAILLVVIEGISMLWYAINPSAGMPFAEQELGREILRILNAVYWMPTLSTYTDESLLPIYFPAVGLWIFAITISILPILLVIYSIWTWYQKDDYAGGIKIYRPEYPYPILRFMARINLCIFVPVCVTLFSIFSCRTGSNSRWMDSSYSCWGATHLVLVVITAIVLPFFLVYSLVAAACFVNRTPNIKRNIMSQAHGRVDVVLMGLKIVLSIIYVFGMPGGKNTMFLLIASLFVGLVWLIGYARFQPYHVFWLNELKCALAGIYISGCVASLVTVGIHKNEYSIGAWIFLFIFPLAAPLGWTMAAYAGRISAKRMELSSPYAVELKARAMLAELDDDHHHNNHSSQLNSANNTTIQASGGSTTFGTTLVVDERSLRLRDIQMLYEDASGVYSHSAMLELFAASFLGLVKGNRHLELLHLRAAESKLDTISIDVRFFVWERLWSIDQIEVKSNTVKTSVVRRLQFDALLNESEELCLRTRGLMLDYWTEACEHTPDMSRLQSIGIDIILHIRRVENIFIQLTELAPQSTTVMRAYADFLLEIANNPKKGLELLQSAEAIEEEESKAHSMGDNESKDYPFMEYTPEFDLSNENVSLLRIAGDPERLGMVVDANAAALKLFGYARRDLLGKNINVLVPEPISTIHQKFLEKYMATGEETVVNTSRIYFAVHRNGHVFPISTNIRPMEEGFGGVLEEIVTSQGFIFFHGTAGKWKVTAACKNSMNFLDISPQLLANGSVSMDKILPELVDFSNYTRPVDFSTSGRHTWEHDNEDLSHTNVMNDRTSKRNTVLHSRLMNELINANTSTGSGVDVNLHVYSWAEVANEAHRIARHRSSHADHSDITRVRNTARLANLMNASLRQTNPELVIEALKPIRTVFATAKLQECLLPFMSGPLYILRWRINKAAEADEKWRLGIQDPEEEDDEGRSSIDSLEVEDDEEIEQHRASLSPRSPIGTPRTPSNHIHSPHDTFHYDHEEHATDTPLHKDEFHNPEYDHPDFHDDHHGHDDHDHPVGVVIKSALASKAGKKPTHHVAIVADDSEPTTTTTGTQKPTTTPAKSNTEEPKSTTTAPAKTDTGNKNSSTTTTKPGAKPTTTPAKPTAIGGARRSSVTIGKPVTKPGTADKTKPGSSTGKRDTSSTPATTKNAGILNKTPGKKMRVAFANETLDGEEDGEATDDNKVAENDNIEISLPGSIAEPTDEGKKPVASNTSQHRDLSSSKQLDKPVKIKDESNHEGVKLKINTPHPDPKVPLIHEMAEDPTLTPARHRITSPIRSSIRGIKIPKDKNSVKLQWHASTPNNDDDPNRKPLPKDLPHSPVQGEKENFNDQEITPVTPISELEPEDDHKVKKKKKEYPVEEHKKSASVSSGSSAGTASVDSLRKGLEIRSHGMEKSLITLRRSLILIFVFVGCMNIASVILSNTLFTRLSLNLHTVADNGIRGILLQNTFSEIQRLRMMSDNLLITKDNASATLVRLQTAVDELAIMHQSLYSRVDETNNDERNLYVIPHIPIQDLVIGSLYSPSNYSYNNRTVNLGNGALEYIAKVRAILKRPYNTNSLNESTGSVFWVLENGPKPIREACNTSMIIAQAKTAGQDETILLANNAVLGIAIGLLFIVTIFGMAPAILRVVREKATIFEVFLATPLTILRQLRATADSKLTTLRSANEDELLGDSLLDSLARENQQSGSYIYEAMEMHAPSHFANSRREIEDRNRTATTESGVTDTHSYTSSVNTDIEKNLKALEPLNGKKARKFRKASHVSNRILIMFAWPILLLFGYYLGTWAWKRNVALSARYAREEVFYANQMQFFVGQTNFNVRNMLTYCDANFLEDQRNRFNVLRSIMENVQDALLYGSTSRNIRPLLKTSSAVFSLMVEDGCVPGTSPTIYDDESCHGRGPTPFFDGLVGKGLQGAYKQYMQSASRIVEYRYEVSRPNSTTPCLPIDVSTGTPLLLESLSERYLAVGFKRFADILRDETDGMLSSFMLADIGVTAASIISLCIFFVGVYSPIIWEMDREIKNVRHLLLLFPDDVTRTTPAIMAVGKRLIIYDGGH